MIRFPRMSDLRRDVATAGGLYTRAGLARRWKVSRQAVGEYVRTPGFPSPIKVDEKTEVWPAIEADAWRHRTKA